MANTKKRPCLHCGKALPDNYHLNVMRHIRCKKVVDARRRKIEGAKAAARAAQKKQEMKERLANKNVMKCSRVYQPCDNKPAKHRRCLACGVFLTDEEKVHIKRVYCLRCSAPNKRRYYNKEKFLSGAMREIIKRSGKTVDQFLKGAGYAP